MEFVKFSMATGTAGNWHVLVHPELATKRGKPGSIQNFAMMLLFCFLRQRLESLCPVFLLDSRAFSSVLSNHLVAWTGNLEMECLPVHAMVLSTATIACFYFVT